ncbi:MULTISPECIES: hypothetical protein [unclassified Gluconobacter]|uniref:hypothetical protein n=1 Tax=unclassified Gluconobacter TaxID=2644261 RepID=UPI001C05AF80|nr:MULTISPECIES: hypothetical protein [unclassified Gluconobacter]
MSILHTLKRKLRSCRRQQDAVLAIFKTNLEREIAKKLKYLADEVYGLASARNIWAAEFVICERRAFEKLSAAEKIALINVLYARAHELRNWYIPIAQLPIHSTASGFQIWMSDLEETTIKCGAYETEQPVKTQIASYVRKP